MYTMSQHAQPQISVIVPVWNEVNTITDLCRDIRAVLETIGQPYEILAIDDGSQDGTRERLLALPFVRTCVHPYNKGNGAAVKTGIRQATGRLLVLLDGDGQHDPKDIPHLLAHAETHELVIGSRPAGAAQSYLRRGANWFYNWLATYVSGQRVVDLTSGFRVVHREVLAQFVPLLPNGFSYPATSTLACIKSGYSVTFVPLPAPSPTPATTVRARLQATYGKLPLHFEVNQGQTASPVQFLSRGPSYTLFLTPTEAVLRLQQGSCRTPGAACQDDTPHSAVVRMQLVGANATPQVLGEERLSGISNYLMGSDRRQWRTGIPHYARVRYRDVYPGVDLVYHGTQGRLEYDFIVAPGADPSAITLAFQGSDTAHPCRGCTPV
jgi:hypothetical protein